MFKADEGDDQDQVLTCEAGCHKQLADQHAAALKRVDQGVKQEDIHPPAAAEGGWDVEGRKHVWDACKECNRVAGDNIHSELAG